jgi:hypothetical protein
LIEIKVDSAARKAEQGGSTFISRSTTDTSAVIVCHIQEVNPSERSPAVTGSRGCHHNCPRSPSLGYIARVAGLVD